jgi:hypothetical protein
VPRLVYTPLDQYHTSPTHPHPAPTPQHITSQTLCTCLDRRTSSCRLPSAHIERAVTRSATSRDRPSHRGLPGTPARPGVVQLRTHVHVIDEPGGGIDATRVAHAHPELCVPCSFHFAWQTPIQSCACRALFILRGRRPFRAVRAVPFPLCVADAHPELCVPCSFFPFPFRVSVRGAQT